MSDDKYASNSHKSKTREESEDKVQRKKPIAKGSTKIKEQSSGKKILDSFIGEDLGIIFEALVDDIKTEIHDGFRNGASHVLHGFVSAMFDDRDYYSSSRSNSSSRRGSSSHHNYGSHYKNSSNKQTRKGSANLNFSYNEITFESRTDAKDVLDQLLDDIDEYGFVRVADFYDYSNLPYEYTDRDYGWENLDRARIESSAEGYYIRLPKAIEL